MNPTPDPNESTEEEIDEWIEANLTKEEQVTFMEAILEFLKDD